MDVQEETTRLRGLYAGRDIELVGLLSGQIVAVKTYAQVLVGLCGLVITVTGFSGAHMIRAGSLSASLMAIGLVLVVIGLALCVRTITVLRWVTQELRDDLAETARVVIQRRNRQQRMVSVAAVFVITGLASYAAAVVVGALAQGSNVAAG